MNIIDLELVLNRKVKENKFLLLGKKRIDTFDLYLCRFKMLDK